MGRDRFAPGRLLLGYAGSWRPAAARPSGFEERRQVEDSVLREVAEVCRRYRARVVTDQHLAPAVVERLRGYGLSVRTVAMTAAFTQTRARLYTGSLELYPHAGLLAELRRLRSRFTAGQAAVVNPRVGGSHGEMAQALAVAVFELDRRGVAASGAVGEAVAVGAGDPAGATGGGAGAGRVRRRRGRRVRLWD